MKSKRKTSGAVIDKALEYIQLTDKQFIDELESGLNKAVEKANHTNTIIVESAISLTDEEQAQFEKLIDAMFGRVVDVTYRIEPKILGGFRIKIGDLNVDASLNNKIEQLVESLKA
ncbi:hypothetical protein C4579_04455 [Candidatus Microgenomates bacterium]|nr:MAG: hypothetical protein C4579_04455 [Candidatus Microgenomates bacterium]